MSHSENPYKPPIAGAPIYVAEAAEPEFGLWRKGNMLVFRKNTELPARCVKSNVPTDRRLKRQLSWHHPAIFLTVLISILVYLILALVLRKTATIQIGLSDKWFGKRRKAIAIGWTSALSGFGMIGVGIAYVEQSDSFGFMILVGVVVFFVGTIYGLVGSRMVTAARINDEHVWLKGVHRDFIADLPEWPHEP